MKCRWCGATALEHKLNLAEMPLTDEFVTRDKIGSEFIQDIDIYQCKDCGLVQNPNDFSFSAYYEEYNYSSGHSSFVKNFMNELCDYTVKKYEEVFASHPISVMEVGSGDGAQLVPFKANGIEVLGVEPSEKLQKEANAAGIKTIKEYFDETTVSKYFYDKKYSVTLSSFTLDHIPSPKRFLENIWTISDDMSLLVFEVHDINLINDRGEWCLFEHEHMIYTNEDFWRMHLEKVGFKVVDVNPLNENLVRANSLIIVAKKIAKKNSDQIERCDYLIETNKIDQVRIKLEDFIDTRGSKIVGWGVGGRGVMTAAMLENYNKFTCFFDSNFKSSGLYLPKTNIMIESLEKLDLYSDHTVVVFSFGYIEEIKSVLAENGFDPKNIFSLKDFF